MVAALNILIALTMMVMEKTRDIAVLMSFGVDPAQIRRIFLLQGFLISVVGTVVGALGSTTRRCWPGCSGAARYATTSCAKKSCNARNAPSAPPNWPLARLPSKASFTKKPANTTCPWTRQDDTFQVCLRTCREKGKRMKCSARLSGTTRPGETEAALQTCNHDEG